MINLRKLTASIFLTALMLNFGVSASAQSGSHTVKSGDSMWLIAVKYQIGLDELKQANPQIKNAALIYPGQVLSIPNIDDVKALENEVVRLVNIQRANNGLGALSQNWELSRAARYKSQDFINKNYFAHQSPTYGSPFDLIKSFGIRYSAAGENIAKGQNSAASVMSSWMNSPGHRSNILSPAYNQIGVGVAKDSKGNLYWTQLFIKSY